MSSASDLPPQIPSATMRKGDLLHNNGQIMVGRQGQFVSETMSGNDPVKIIDGFGAGIYARADERGSQSRSRSPVSGLSRDIG